MSGRHRMGVTISVHVDESATVQARTDMSSGGRFALVVINGDGYTPRLDLFFRTVADLDRVVEAMRTARHELAALTEHESVGDTANTNQVATHANAA